MSEHCRECGWKTGNVILPLRDPKLAIFRCDFCRSYEIRSIAAHKNQLV